MNCPVDDSHEISNLFLWKVKIKKIENAVCSINATDNISYFFFFFFIYFYFSAGLVENLIEHVKQTHMKLNMSSLQVGKNSLSKGKDEPIIQELVMTFDLLRNFMYQSEEVKVS